MQLDALTLAWIALTVLLIASGVLALAWLRASARAHEAQARAHQERADAAERALARAQADLDQLTYAASHDLRAPLRHVFGYEELLKNRYATSLDDRGREFLAGIRRGAVQLDLMVTALLRLSRLPPTPTRSEDVDMTEIARAATERLKKTFPSVDIHLDVAPLPAARGDAAQLSILLQELLTNCATYRGEPPLVITLRGASEGAFCRYEVIDNGQGFDPSQGERIFGIFQRLVPPGGPQGAGVGLALVKRIVEGHGGTIRAQAAPGQGATFTFTLPA